MEKLSFQEATSLKGAQRVINPRRMREGYGSRSVCLSVTAVCVNVAKFRTERYAHAYVYRVKHGTMTGTCTGSDHACTATGQRMAGQPAFVAQCKYGSEMAGQPVLNVAGSTVAVRVLSGGASVLSGGAGVPNPIPNVSSDRATHVRRHFGCSL